MNHLWLFILLSILAEVFGTIGGFGSSVFFVPVAGFFLSFQSVLGITALFHLSSNLVKIGMFRKGIEWRVVLILGIPSVIFVILGAWVCNFFDARPLEKGLGIFLMTMALVFLIWKKFNIGKSVTAGVLGGSLSGFLAGLFGSGGPVRGLALAAYNLPKDVFIATSALIDLAIDLSRSVVYVSNGFVKKEDLYLIPIMLVVSIVGTYFGKKILNKISQDQFRIIVLVLIFVVGAVTLFKEHIVF